MAIRILTEDDKLELERKIAQSGTDLTGYATEKFVEEAIAEAGSIPDVVIQTPSTQPEVNWSAENFSVVAGSLQKAWNRGNAGQKPVVWLRWAEDFGFDRNREFYEPVHITSNMIHGGTDSKISLEFSVGMYGGIWNFVLTSEGESNIYADVFTGYSYSFVSSADLTGYATEDFVRNKIAEAELGGEEVDMSGYAQKSELPTKVSQLANDSGYLTKVPDGYASEAFVEDKIAEAAMGGGEVDLLVAATWPFENAPASSFVVGAGSLDQLWRKVLEENYNPVVYMAGIIIRRFASVHSAEVVLALQRKPALFWIFASGSPEKSGQSPLYLRAKTISPKTGSPDMNTPSCRKAPAMQI